MSEEAMSVKVRGPIFDGRANIMISSACRRAAEVIATYAEDLVHATLQEVLQHPTGAYESRINVRAVNQYAYAVNDDNCIYGPWLEGVGSRNYPVTRFKGYGTFRKVSQELQGAAVLQTEDEINHAVDEINMAW